jgi:hypothetical protein
LEDLEDGMTTKGRIIASAGAAALVALTVLFSLAGCDNWAVVEGSSIPAAV